ncbi:MAG: MalY/PatB family protein [Kiritimatiellia bacterium]
MKYNFEHCPPRRPTESEKWLEYPEDVLPLWVADMDFVSPEPVVRAIRDRVEHRVFGYGRDRADLKELIVRRMEERYAWRIREEDVVLIPGVIRGFNLACRATAMPGGEALVQTPIYPPMLYAPGHAGLVRRDNELAASGSAYEINWADFEAALNGSTRVFLLCNPHNPTGRVFRRDELHRMGELCLKHGVVICSDEIHCDLIFSGQTHIPIASLSPELAAQSITLMSPSKTFNIAGLDCSFAIIQNPDLRKRFNHARAGLVGGVNILGQAAAVAALRDGQEWLDQVLAVLESNRDYLFDYVREKWPSVRMFSPEATYLAWLDCRALNLENPHEFFLSRAKVAFNDGATFGKGGEGFVRINFACPRKTLEEALSRCTAALRAAAPL